MSGQRAPGRWADSAVGGHRVPAACLLTTTPEGAGPLAASIGQRLERLGFVPDGSAGAPAASGVRVLRRGSVVGDTILNGTGLGLLTKRIGPLSYRGVVVLEISSAAGETPSAPRSRVVASLVAGGELASEFADAVDAAIGEALAAGAVLDGPGWMRAVDLPEDSAGNPRTAHRVLGIR